MKLCICGGRDFNNYNMVKEAIAAYQNNSSITHIISGKARGADSLGERWARENLIPVLEFPAHWDKFGKGAGPMRNTEMAKTADAVIVFWDGESRGTKHMISQCEQYNTPYRIIYYEMT